MPAIFKMAELINYVFMEDGVLASNFCLRGKYLEYIKVRIARQ